ncbi:flagellar biosynthesis protein [Clostridium fermenticellae]|uniref:Flagellar biosynthesis protein n=1 Tax=Clostridium fermenticellae TaxID=2068654 RepID=A0A386H4N1_9CLOT|nr:TIGR02530 family flagellar biosynthesis protein [Clostridium fermenticellae]AYD40679.1 flagellar biosynthesis protein [Clostridium fermenticellae]
MGYRVIDGKVHITWNFEPYNKEINTQTKESKRTSFDEILNKKVREKDGFVISNHAALRLRERNINFNESDMKSINEGINKAEAKGCKQALILYKDTALVTSIKNRTIITAVNSKDNGENVFTNIDSAVIL